MRAASKSAGGERFAGAAVEFLFAEQDAILDRLGESAGRLAHSATDQVDDAGRERDVSIGVQDVFVGQFVGDHEQGHVTDRFTGWRDLDDVAEQLVHASINLADFRPTIGQA